MLGGYAKALSQATSLKTNFTVTPVGATLSQYRLEAVKPNLVRMETDSSLILADGKEIITFDPRSKIFYRQPQNDESMRSAMASGPAMAFAPFFMPQVYAKVLNPKATGLVKRKGLDLEGVRFSPTNEPALQLVTFYLPRTDFLVRQAEMVFSSGPYQLSGVLDTTLMEIDKEISSERFVWRAPGGSLELPYDLATGRAWFTDINIAKEVSRRTQKILFLNFHVGSCPGCQALKRGVFTQPEVMRLSRNFVLAEVNTETQPGIAKQYGVVGHPVFHFYRHDGTLLDVQAADFTLRDMVRIFQRVLALER